MALSQKQKKDVARTIAGFAAAGCVAALLIFLGNRNDAVSEAERLKAGVLTAHQIHASFETVGGRLTERPVEAGRTVEAGEALLGIDGTDVKLSTAALEAQIRQTQAQRALEAESIALALSEADTAERTSWRQIEEAQAARRSAAAARDRARTAWARAEKLYPQGAMAEAAYDEAKAGWVSAREALLMAERTVSRLTVGAAPESLEKLARTGSAEGMRLETIENARQAAKNRGRNLEHFDALLAQLCAQLEQLRVNASRLVIHAPERAKVLEVLYEKGELVAPNTPAVLLETERRYFDFYVSETQAARLHEGDKIPCFAPALDREVEGTVRLVDAAPDFVNLRMVRERGQADLTLFKVRVDVAPTDGLLTGMTLEVRL